MILDILKLNLGFSSIYLMFLKGGNSLKNKDDLERWRVLELTAEITISYLQYH
jgi:hypothetical protein